MKLEDTDYKMREYVRVRKDEYEELTKKVLQLQKELEEEKHLHQLDEKTEDMYRNLYLEERQKFYNLKVWLEEDIKKLNPNNLEIGELNLILDDVKFYSYIQLKEVLERLVGDGNE